MAVTGGTMAGGTNIMSGEVIAGTHMGRRHRRVTIRKRIMIITVVMVQANITAK
ncbi:hypothetical protein EA14781_033_00270 [Escherichia albertii NBRC 107761 = DSM 17582]|nr:hypothetical protein EA14781_033_00270 [Escherichia albertii NBRC 107761 = DSM 17582]